MSLHFHKNAAACLLVLLVGVYFHLGGQPVAVGLMGAYDKLGHFVVYAAVTVLLWLACGGRRPWALFCAVALIGIADEWYQSLLPGRIADLSDFATDLSAASVVLLFLSRVSRRRTLNKVFDQSRD